MFYVVIFDRVALISVYSPPPMSDSEPEPAIDWSKDDDVLAVGRKTDGDVLAKAGALPTTTLMQL